MHINAAAAGLAVGGIADSSVTASSAISSVFSESASCISAGTCLATGSGIAAIAAVPSNAPRAAGTAVSGVSGTAVASQERTGCDRHAGDITRGNQQGRVASTTSKCVATVAGEAPACGSSTEASSSTCGRAACGVTTSTCGVASKAGVSARASGATIAAIPTSAISAGSSGRGYIRDCDTGNVCAGDKNEPATCAPTISANSDCARTCPCTGSAISSSARGSRAASRHY